MSRHILETALAHGVGLDQCLAGTGLTPATLADAQAEVQAIQELTLTRNLVSHLGDVPGIGVETGCRYNLADTGILGYAILSSPTLGDAMDVARRFIPLSAAGLDRGHRGR